MGYLGRQGEPWDMHVYDGDTAAQPRGFGAANLLALCEAAFNQAPDDEDGAQFDFGGGGGPAGGRRDQNGANDGDKPRPARPRPQNRQVGQHA